MRHFFILNPTAGSSGLWARFAKNLPEGSTVSRTQRRGHASELAQQAVKQGCERVVAVGGDGTLSEVVHGLLSGGGVPRGFILAHLPAGSGRDTARHFGLPFRPEDWAGFLANGKPGLVDAARARWKGSDGREVERYFINIAMAGIAGDIAHTMERTGKPLGGLLSYLAVSLAHILSDRARLVEVTVDGRTLQECPYHLLALANTRTTGGGMLIAPDADAQDGWLEYVAVREMRRPRLLWSFPKIYRGKHLAVSGVDSGRAKKISLSSRQPVRMNIDGEAVGTLPASFEILPKALPFLLP